jgi:predicted XRE-type DNA-binding protein
MPTMQQIDTKSKEMRQIYLNLRQQGLTYRQVGEIMGVSQEWARRQCIRHLSDIERGIVHG